MQESRLTLADVGLGETPDGAFHGDLLGVVILHHLQAPRARILPHYVHHLAVVRISIRHSQMLLCDACYGPWKRVGERRSLSIIVK